MNEGPREADREAIGLCADCRHARRVPTPRAVYWLCGRAADDPRFEKYPRLPVVDCEGHERGPHAPAQR